MYSVDLEKNFNSGRHFYAPDRTPLLMEILSVLSIICDGKILSASVAFSFKLVNYPTFLLDYLLCTQFSAYFYYVSFIHVGARGNYCFLHLSYESIKPVD